MPKTKTKPVPKRSNKSNLGGHPPFLATDADRALVQALKGCGIANEDIASVLRPGGVSADTLARHFRHELDSGKAQIDALAITGLVKKLQAQDSAAIFFYLKTRLGWREKSQTDHRFVDEEGKDRDISTAKQELAAEIARIAARTAPE